MTSNSPPLSTVAFVRHLRIADSGELATLSVYVPERVGEDPEEWRCRVEVAAPSKSLLAYEGRGGDSFQAVISSLSVMRARLRSCQPRLAWGDRDPGELGIPVLSTSLDEYHLDLVESLLAAETARQLIWQRSLDRAIRMLEDAFE